MENSWLIENVSRHEMLWTKFENSQKKTIQFEWYDLKQNGMELVSLMKLLLNNTVSQFQSILQFSLKEPLILLNYWWSVTESR